ncbi:MAG TPA: VanZ family protein [Terrimicrobiaceae bacterium]|nr:VanZ family protein [Terrimicrobiaceae bacterium]
MARPANDKAEQDPSGPDPGKLLRPFSFATIALWFAFLLWVIFVFWLSSLTSKDLSSLPKMFAGFDKVVHFMLFFTGSVFLTLAIRGTFRWTWPFVILTSVTALSLFGLADEYHQLFTSGRSGADLGDWTADFLGALAAATGCFLASRIARRAASASRDLATPAGGPQGPDPRVAGDQRESVVPMP